jgi:HK97 gp10 family phage protein
VATGATLEGVAELTAKLNELGVQVAARELRGTAKEALEIAEHKARSLMPQGEEPHKTYRGRLVSGGYALTTLHIETKLDKRTGSAVATLGVGREAFYAVQFVELGTAHMAARPWLRPALEGSQNEMLEQISKSLKTRVERATKSAKRAAQRARLARR